MMEAIKDIIANMVIEYYGRYESRHDDLVHTQQVVSYTRLIAVGEGLAPKRVSMLESAAWLHDIGCPQSKEIYGNSEPINQQKVGEEVSRELLASISVIPEQDKRWLIDVVATHHQHASATKLGFEPLYEADLIVNILSGYHHISKAGDLYKKLMASKTGKRIFKALIDIE